MLNKSAERSQQENYGFRKLSRAPQQRTRPCPFVFMFVFSGFFWGVLIQFFSVHQTVNSWHDHTLQNVCWKNIGACWTLADFQPTGKTGPSWSWSIWFLANVLCMSVGLVIVPTATTAILFLELLHLRKDHGCVWGLLKGWCDSLHLINRLTLHS